MKLFLLVFLTLSMSASHVRGAAVKTTGTSSPVYDEDFMRKLCAFLGATYVRSVKDPMCWYTWCHNGEPYHMQCAAGRAVSKHFYWSKDDPCTESDSGEQCLVGYLKNMHLEKNKDDEEIFEKQEDPEILVSAPKSHDTEDVVENTLEEIPIEEESEYEGNYYDSPQDTGGARQAPLLTDSKHDPEPLPELDPEVAGPTLDEVVIKKIEPNGNEDNVYFPEQHRAHIVEAFVPQNPIPLYGGYRRYNGPFHYFPRKFYPAPTQEQPSKNRALIEEEEEDEPEEPVEKVVLTTTAEPHYLPPMARSARLVGRQMAIAEAQDQHRNTAESEYSSDYKPEHEDYNREYDYHPEYIYEDQQSSTTAENTMPEEAVASPEDTTEEKRESRKEQDKEDAQEEELIDAAESIFRKDEPIVYDYFKTHFVEEV